MSWIPASLTPDETPLSKPSPFGKAGEFPILPKKPFNYSAFGNANQPSSNATLLPDFGFKQAEPEVWSGTAEKSSNPQPLPDFGFKKAEPGVRSGTAEKSSSNPLPLPDFGFRKAENPSVLANRSALREDLNAVAKVLERWSNYPYLVFQAVDSEKIDVKELWGYAGAIVEAKDKILLAFVQGINGTGPAELRPKNWKAVLYGPSQ
jgi:hypothetical protein